MSLLIFQESTSVSTSTEQTRPGTEFCLFENVVATCPAELHVKITRAELGRMRLNRCVNQDHGYIGCSDLVTDKVQELCQRTSTCRFHVSSLGQYMQSCPSSKQPYLYVEHECVTRKFFILR